MAKSRKTKKSRQQSKKSAPSVQKQSPNLWERQSDTVQHVICLVLLVVVSFSFFAPIHFKGKSLFAYDTVSFKAMSNEMVKYREETGETALWSPNPFGGMPGYMISSPTEVAQLDDIPRFLRSIIWPSSHFLFLLAGTYFLAFYLVRDKWASMLAAVAYGLTTYVPVILVAGHNSKFITMAFAPWLILAFAFALRRPGVLGGFLFAIALAVNLRAGHIQITYYCAFVMGIWWLVEGVSAFRNQSLATFGKVTGWLAIGSILGILMVAQPFLLNYEYKEHTIRGTSAGGEAGAGGLSWAYAMNWSQGWGELVTLIISDAYGGSAAYWGLKPGTGGPHYVGGIVFLLALFAAFSIKKNVVRGLAIAALFMTLLSLGQYFEVLNRLMFNYFPLFSSFRVPETWLGIVALVLAILAAFGLKHGLDSLKSGATQLQPVLKYIGAGVAVMVVLLTMKNVFFEFERPGEREQLIQRVASQNNLSTSDPQVINAVDRGLVEFKQDRSDRYTNDAIRTLLLLLVAGGVFFLYRKGTIPQFLAGLLIVAAVTIDLGTVGRRYFNEDRLTDARQADDLVAEYGFDTFLINKKNELGGNGHFRVLSLEGVLTEVARPAYHYETLGGYHGAKLRYYQDYLESILFDERGFPNTNALDLLNTKYVVFQRPLPGMDLAYRDEQSGMLVLERKDALPRAYFVGNTEVIEDAEATWARIQSPDFDPGKTAILPRNLDITTTPIDSSSTAIATLKKHTPHEIAWDVNTDADRLLVVSEVYYPDGWKAFLDGNEVPIHRVDYLLRGVQVDAGQHELVMRFDPQSYHTGYWVTMISTILAYGTVLALLGMGYMRRRENETAGAPVQAENTPVGE